MLGLFKEKSVIDEVVTPNTRCVVPDPTSEPTLRDDFNLILEIQRRAPRKLTTIEDELIQMDARRKQLLEERKYYTQIIAIPAPGMTPKDV